MPVFDAERFCSGAVLGSLRIARGWSNGRWEWQDVISRVVTGMRRGIRLGWIVTRADASEHICLP